MDDLNWKNTKESITLDSHKRQIIACNITDNPHESFESYESFEDFLLDKNLSSMRIKAYFSEAVYLEILQEVRNRCTQ